MARSTSAQARSTTQHDSPSRPGRGRRPAEQPSAAAADWAGPDTTLFRDCIDACNRCLAYCLRQGGHHAGFQHIGSLIDCLEVCSTTADLAGRNSPAAPALIQVCAELAQDCAKSCDEHGRGLDAELGRCAEACRDLADWCLLQASAPQG